MVGSGSWCARGETWKEALKGHTVDFQFRLSFEAFELLLSLSELLWLPRGATVHAGGQMHALKRSSTALKRAESGPKPWESAVFGAKHAKMSCLERILTTPDGSQGPY